MGNISTNSNDFSFLVFFSYGFKIQFKDGEIPFFIVLFCGFAPWLYLTDALSGGTNSIVSHSYLVKKIAFPTEILPSIHLVVAFKLKEKLSSM